MFEIGEVIDEEVVPNKRFDIFYQWLLSRPDTAGRPAIVQFNHPKSFKQDYGVLNVGSIEALLPIAAPHVRTIQIINGPHDATSGGHRITTVKSESYLQYLNAGFRLAPTADQDNHFITHGTATDHRTAVLAPSLTKRDILEGIRQRRVYASQDRNLRIFFTINDQPLGSVVQLAAGAPLDIRVSLEDPDEGQGEYRVSLRRDVVGGSLEAEEELANHDVVGNSTAVFDQFKHTPEDEYFLVQIVQEGSDGADQAWTAPIWIVAEVGEDVHPRDDEVPAPGPAPHPEEFVWSQNADVYHLAECSVVRQIAEHNKIAGHQPPAGKRLHSGCPR